MDQIASGALPATILVPQAISSVGIYVCSLRSVYASEAAMLTTMTGNTVDQFTNIHFIPLMY
jgi:hypothetical protein